MSQESVSSGGARGRPARSSSATSSQGRYGPGPDQLPFIPLPLIDGAPAYYRREDDTNCCMSIHGPERVRKAFEEIKAAYGTSPSWSVLHVLIQHYLEHPPEHARPFVMARREQLAAAEPHADDQ